jgi:hypothetical protein
MRCRRLGRLYSGSTSVTNSPANLCTSHTRTGGCDNWLPSADSDSDDEDDEDDDDDDDIDALVVTRTARPATVKLVDDCSNSWRGSVVAGPVTARPAQCTSPACMRRSASRRLMPACNEIHLDKRTIVGIVKLCDTASVEPDLESTAVVIGSIGCSTGVFVKVFANGKEEAAETNGSAAVAPETTFRQERPFCGRTTTLCME